ncbi:unnamed protein product [Adineta ricciae]|uniref:Protein quiver n=2 Tax=Adineta ricciae TaxID=249248 RepID=A0A814X1E9_ADIRI|nr:unnamed protein product [Adineta ricciae]
MHTSYIILSIILLFTALNISNERGAGVCYSCVGCPKPFTPDLSSVMQVYTSTGWCSMMSNSDSSDATFTRNAAPPGLCYTKGCSWQIVNGAKTWVCCCDGSLCNGDPPTTLCYDCTNCPKPFNRKSVGVSTADSRTGWCYRRSTSNEDYASVDRGVALSGICAWNECSWKIIDRSRYWVCCCNGDKCNSAVSMSTSAIYKLITGALLIVMFQKKFLD